MAGVDSAWRDRYRPRPSTTFGSNRTKKTPGQYLLLTGARDHQADCMGLYILQEVQHNNRPVYKHEARNRYIFYWKDTQQWLVGSNYESYKWDLAVYDKHTLPEEITGTWKVSLGARSLERKLVKLQPVELNQPTTALLLTGIIEHQKYRSGLYLLHTDGHNQPVYQNNRPVYKHEARDQYIHFWKERQQWLVGPDILQARGGLYVEDSCVLPEDITGTWMVSPPGPGWVEDRNVTLLPAPEKHPAPTLLLSGAPKSVTGLYILQTDVDNRPLFSGSRPVYKHKATTNYIFFWKMTQEWWVGPDIHAASGCLHVEDSHVLPENIKGTWKVETAKGWEEDKNVTLSTEPATVLLLTGMTEHQTYCRGLYVLQKDDNNMPKLYNNRPVYKHEEKVKYIYFWKEKQQWLVGPDILKAQGWLYVEDSHVLPEDITGTWMVATPSHRWVEDRNVTLQPEIDITGTVTSLTGNRGRTGATEVSNLMSALSTSSTSNSFYTKAAKPPFLGGKAVIINNINFTHESRRIGATQDTRKVKDVFEMLGLSVDTYLDQTVLQMLSLMRKQGETDHSAHGCLICCIMTHGDHGKVCGTDGSIDILELVNLVSGRACPSLVGKPKVFIVQACQGSGRQDIVFADSAGLPPGAIDAFHSSVADVYIGLATVPGYAAYRSLLEGAFYINKFVEVLAREGQKLDLQTMMTMVNEEMNSDYMSSPFCCSTLTKKLYFVLPK